MPLSVQELREILNTGEYPYSSEDAASLHNAQSKIDYLREQYDSLKDEYKNSAPDRERYNKAKKAVSEGDELDLVDFCFGALSFVAKKTKSCFAKNEMTILETKINDLQSRLDNAEAQYNECLNTINKIQNKYRAQIENQLLALMGYKIENYDLLCSRIPFGQYNGENIMWDVICRKGNKILLFSYQPVFFAPFNTTYEPTVWAVSSIRKLLNGNFLQSSFSGKERVHICETTVQEATGFGSHKSPQTSDYLFLLSNKEIKAYFSSLKAALRFYDYDRETGFARVASYWLRNPGEDYCCGQVLSYTDAPIYLVGIAINEPNVGVCPAMWISL